MRWSLIAAVGVVLATAPEEGRATVYTWREGDGVRHFTNSLDEVPEDHRATAKTFVRRDAPSRDAAPAESAPATPEPADDSYHRAVELGATIALEQTREIGELARSLVDSLRRDPTPPREVRRVERPAREKPGFHVSIIPAGRRWPERVFYGAIAPTGGCSGCCCGNAFGYGWDFGWRRLVPHSHFFPTLAGARRSGLFFPHGHQLDADLFLVGDGYWVD
jgi:hypothetical protein